METSSDMAYASQGLSHWYKDVTIGQLGASQNASKVNTEYNYYSEPGKDIDKLATAFQTEFQVPIEVI